MLGSKQNLGLISSSVNWIQADHHPDKQSKTSLGTQRCQGNQKLLRRLPALERFYRETNFSL